MKSNRKKMDRRTFLKATGMGGASLALSAGLSNKFLTAEAAQVDSSGNNGVPTRILGKTGVSVPILSLGGIIDWTTNQSLLRMSLRLGINYWDTAHNYENGKSELGIGQYFEKYPEDRKNVFLVSKCSGSNEPRGMTERLNTSFERMKTDYVDLYFLHGPDRPDLLSPEVKAWADQMKKEGKIKFFGFSAHSNMAQMLMHSANLGWIDVIMPSYNYSLMNDDDIDRAVDACYKADIGLVAMKTQGQRFGPRRSGGDEDLAVTEAFMAKGYTLHQARLKAVWSDGRIASCLSALYNLTILKENVAAATDNVQLSVKDMEVLDRLARANCGLYCKGCMSCASAMASESRIHDILRYMMYYNSYGERDEARRLFRALPPSVRKGLTSRDYTKAEGECPQKIEIGKMMVEAERLLG
jgi:predicted aldo/keto reductase-like oxidoreductase